MSTVGRTMVALLPLLAGCASFDAPVVAGEGTEENAGETAAVEQELCDPAYLTDAQKRGKEVFEVATFGGNDRTCRTCHDENTGTLNPAQVQAKFRANPRGPLFRSIDSNDGKSNNFSQLLADATIRVTFKLPPVLQLVNNPSATHVTVRRGIGSTVNTPALDNVLMFDGREQFLTTQAKNAVAAHYQPTVVPTSRQLSDVAAFQKTLFSSCNLKNFAAGGAAPGLPQGSTAAEKRGRVHFLPDGMCGQCHSGPMLDEASDKSILDPPGTRFENIAVSMMTGDLVAYRVLLPDGTNFIMESSDPGRILTTGDVNDLNMFRIGSLRNAKNTAPYFHNNSAKTLAEVVEFYSTLFIDVNEPPFVEMTDQQKADILAYLKLL